MEQVLSILAALLILCVFVFVHELGHYTAGRLLGFRIQEFAIGMGPIVYKKEKKGILYSLRALPIGGMCRFYGEDEAPSAKDSFNAQRPWKRLLVVLSGPAMNILFAVLFAAISLFAYGDVVPAVSGFADGASPAREQGMMAGDIIRAVDGKRVEYYDDVIPRIRAANGEHAVITVERDGKPVDLEMNNIYDAGLGRNYLGINIEPVRKPFGVLEAVGGSFVYVGSVIRQMFDFLGNLFTNGVQQGDFVGPVGTITYIGQAVRLGFETVLRIGVLISINLAIFNILPLPALDGGRTVFILVEWIRGKPIPAEREGMVHFVGILLLFGLMIVLTFGDVSRLLGG